VVAIGDYPGGTVPSDALEISEGAIRYDGQDLKAYVDPGNDDTPAWVSLTSDGDGGGAGAGYKLTRPDLVTDVIVVDSSGNTTVSGAMTFAAPMGDIPMFGQ
jgi:hypothetical protein